MKTFIASTCLFCLLLFALGFNCQFVGTTCDQLTDLAQKISLDDIKNADTAVTALNRIWEERKPFLRLSTNFSKLEKLESHIISMEIFLRDKNEASLIIEKELFLSSISDLKFFESLHP